MVLPVTVPVWLQTQAHITVLTLPGSAPLAELAAPSPQAGSLSFCLFAGCRNSQMFITRLLRAISQVSSKEMCRKLLLEALTGHWSLRLQAGTLLVDNEGVGRSDVHQMLEYSGGPPSGLPVD